MVEKKSWEEFRNAGLLWFINRSLHIFGWAIVVEYDDKTGNLTDVYPARVKYRGFSEDVETRGFKKLSKYMAENAKQLEKEANE